MLICSEMTPSACRECLRFSYSFHQLLHCFLPPFTAAQLTVKKNWALSLLPPTEFRSSNFLFFFVHFVCFPPCISEINNPLKCHQILQSPGELHRSSWRDWHVDIRRHFISYYCVTTTWYKCSFQKCHSQIGRYEAYHMDIVKCRSEVASTSSYLQSQTVLCCSS